MKYIKRYNESFESTYQRISIEDYESFFDDRDIENFTNHEISTIKNIIENWDDKYEVAYYIYDCVVMLKFGMTGKGKRRTTGEYFGTEINIVKLSDNWYMINTIKMEDIKLAEKKNVHYERYRKFYKCDQFEPVIEFLGDFLLN